MEIPFFKPSIGEEEINEVVDTLKSGWLTTGPKTKKFEEEFAKKVKAKYAIAVNSCTAALHLAVEALKLKADESVLVPSMTFAATAEVIRYVGADPILVDVEEDTLHVDLKDAERRLKEAKKKVVGIIPVHVAGLMVDLKEVKKFAQKYGLWVVEDAAHSFPSYWREDEGSEWKICGDSDSQACCFSFYANKTITTGEGGMATTNDEEIAQRIRIMSLHGISKNAYQRYTSSGSWYYEIVAPGFKYNLTDLASSIGLHQLKKAEIFRKKREEIAKRYLEAFKDLDVVDLPPVEKNRIHSWHLFYLRLKVDEMKISRNEFIEKLKERGILTSVHWMPLHMHPYYKNKYGYRDEDLNVSYRVFKRLVSLPIYPDMTDKEIDYVIENVRALCEKYRN